MIKCGKGCMPECQYFTTGGCMSPFNCPYKIETGYINSATSTPHIMSMTNEEMIENLKCVIADISAQCNQLKAENAELRARLEEAVGLPCKLGDTIYKVYDKCDGYNCPYNGHYGQWRCHYEGERRCEPFIKIEQFCYSDIPFVNDTVFVSREAAEARLKEIKEDI